MPLQLIEYTDVRRFRDAVIGRLLASEAEYCLQVGLIERLVQQPDAPVSENESDRPLLWTVQEGADVDLVAMQTLKDRMIVTAGSPEAIECLAKALVARHWAGRLIEGVSPAIETLADRYALLSGRPHRRGMQLRTFKLMAVVWPRPVQGSIRICQSDDRPLLAKFIQGFAADIGDIPESPPTEADALAGADRAIAAHRVFFWVDQQPVAMAAWAGPTPNGIRVNLVYTPPEFRRRGYASNLVAHLTQRLLDEGRKFCFLFTDKANPTSNSIYQKMGYRPVCDSEHWEFEDGKVTG